MTGIVPSTAALTGQSATPGTAQPGVATTVKHMMGMLWYEMLSQLNQSGLDPDSLGAGGSAFQGMFLWNIAQNDFGKYDSGLVSATLRQIGGRANAAPASETAAPQPADLMMDNSTALTAAPALMAEAVQDSTTPSSLGITGNAPSAGALLRQATHFAQTVWPDITTAAQKLGVPPVALLAQTALETGWGTSAAGNNLFGIKAVDGESGTSRPTQEVIDGVLTPQMATFRDYASPSASVSDYVSQILSGFQNVVGQDTVGGFAQALQAGGYATDSNYASKIISISQSPIMERVLQAVGGQAANASPQQ
jgi:peptidoglycan hydrolase FlgJ